MRTRPLPLYIPSDMYARLERLGQTEERNVLQQARWILRRALDAPDEQPQTASPEEDAALGAV